MECVFGRIVYTREKTTTEVVYAQFTMPHQIHICGTRFSWLMQKLSYVTSIKQKHDLNNLQVIKYTQTFLSRTNRASILK